MIERSVPRDISRYESAVVGSLTLRQVVCFVPGLTAAAVTGFTLYGRSGELAILLAVVFAVPFLLFGAWKPFGIPLEKFIGTALYSVVLSPARRRHVSGNVYYGLLPPKNADDGKRRPFTARNSTGGKHFV